MNSRSAVREGQLPGGSVRRGEVLVPSTLSDPVHGTIDCGAAPLVAGSLRRRGYPVRIEPVASWADAPGDADDPVLFMATCQGRDGAVSAIAAAAAPNDGLSAAAARAAVQEWIAAFDARTVVVAASPWCEGARRALELAGRALRDSAGLGSVVHIYGDMAGPAEARAGLAEQGAVIGSALAEMVRGDIVVFPAHGVTPQDRAEARERGLAIVDATCPLVAAAQQEAGRLAKRGDHVVVIGQPDHAATPAITASAAGHATVIGTAAGTAALGMPGSSRVSYLLQPGEPTESAAAVAAALRSRFPAARAPQPDSFCYAASDRAGTIKMLAASCDLMLVVGDQDSADARQLAGLARDCGARAQIITDVGDITPAMLAGIGVLGVAESTVANSGAADQVITALAGLGQVSIVRRQVRSDVTTRPDMDLTGGPDTEVTSGPDTEFTSRPGIEVTSRTDVDRTSGPDIAQAAPEQHGAIAVG
jgi:4-hydroxy-3-methylbut-2-en-1-yl diphosphate reductase